LLAELKQGLADDGLVIADKSGASGKAKSKKKAKTKEEDRAGKSDQEDAADEQDDDGEDGGGQSEGDIEIVFEPGLKEAGAKLLGAVNKKEKEKKQTVWERYQERRKQKRKERKLAERMAKATEVEAERAGKDSESEDAEEDEEQQAVISDDEVVGVDDDPFFAAARPRVAGKPTASASNVEPKKKTKSKPTPKSQAELDEEKRQRAELELLAMDDEARNGAEKEAGGYNLRRLLLEEELRKKGKLSSGKQRRLDKLRLDDDAAPDTKDKFELDVKDERFSRLFEDPRFHIDPTDPSFRPTLASEKLLQEKQRRRRERMDEEERAVRERKAQKGLVKDGAAHVPQSPPPSVGKRAARDSEPSRPVKLAKKGE
jgi:hypothetical protein